MQVSRKSPPVWLRELMWVGFELKNRGSTSGGSNRLSKGKEAEKKSLEKH